MCAPVYPVNDAKWRAPVHGASFQDFLSSIGQTPLTREALEGNIVQYVPFIGLSWKLRRIDSFTSFPEERLYVSKELATYPLACTAEDIRVAMLNKQFQ